MLTFADLRNDSRLEFKDLTSEEWRRYYFSDGNSILIENPVAIYVSGNGHRILDGMGISHYIPNGWIHLAWSAKADLPHFVF